MPIIYNDLIPFSGYKCMCLFGILFARKKFKGKLSDIDINHERIHARQQIELLLLPFLLWYALEWLIRLLIYGEQRKAYRGIVFEQEAYANETNLDYLKTRKWFAWFRYY